MLKSKSENSKEVAWFHFQIWGFSGISLLYFHIRMMEETECMVMKPSNIMLKLMAPGSGVHAEGRDQNEHIVNMN